MAWEISQIEKSNSVWNDLDERLLGEIALHDPLGPLPLASLRSLGRG
jgi:hypothetical protein